MTNEIINEIVKTAPQGVDEYIHGLLCRLYDQKKENPLTTNEEKDLDNWIMQGIQKAKQIERGYLAPMPVPTLDSIPE